MAVDYTKVFTVIGSHVDKVNDYYAYISTFTTDQAAIETILSAQSLVRLEGDLPDEYQTFKDNVSSWIGTLINRVTDVLTDITLIGANFSFGTSPTLDIVFPALIKDMTDGDKNVTASVPTVGSPNYTTTNATVGTLITGTTLDGVTPPMSGALAILSYSGLSTQLVPDSETLTFTCIDDSEHGTLRGSEIFEITGTQAISDPYSSTGENIGNLGSITVPDNQATTFITNSNFDSWTSLAPDSWTVGVGGEVAGTDFQEGATTLYGSGSSLETLQTDQAFTLTQTLSSSIWTRHKSYWLTAWARKSIVTLAVDETITITIGDDNGLWSAQLSAQPSTTNWTLYKVQFIPPIEIVGDVVLTVNSANESTNDPMFLDQIVVVPCEYFAGISAAIFGGPEKWLIGDEITVALSNNNAGVFQTFFRKAYKIQLPTDATPTISDSLVT